HARLFAKGRYAPITVEGKFADHIVAFARELGTGMAITVVPRLSHKLLREGSIVFQEAIWEDTRLVLDGEPRAFVNVLDAHRAASEGGRLHVGPLLRRLPVALLVT